MPDDARDGKSTAPIPLVDFVTSPQWVAWRNEMRNGKITKVPYCSATRQAEADEASTWLPHDQAVLIANAIVNGSGGGIGIELGQCGQRWIVGVDLDTCRDPVSGAIEPWAVAVIQRLNSYTEVSPSETGVKAFFLIDPDDVLELRRIMGTAHGRQFKRANGSGHPPSIEFYLSNRYFTVTWEGLADAPADLRVVPLEDLRWLIEEVGPTFSGKDEGKRGGFAETATILGRLNTAAMHNKTIDTALRNAATLAGGSRSEGALGLGAALKRAGWSFEDMKAALCACPATRDWAGAAAERQFERIWARSDDQATGKPDTGPAAASAPRNKLFDPWAKLNSPTLPKNALPAVLQAFVEDRHELMGADIGALAWSAISASSAAIDGSIRLQMKTHDKWHITPNIWVAVIGPPSSMKTPIINAAWRPLVHAQKHYMDEWKRRLADWKAAPKKERDDDMPVPTLRFVSNDATIEAIQDILSRQNRGMGYLRDELAGWICQFEKYGSNKAGGADRAFFLQSFDGGSHVIDRVGRGLVSVDNCLLTLCGGIQPQRLRQFADITDDGLWQRFVPIIAGPHEMGCDRPRSSFALTDYEKVITDILEIPPRITAQLSNDAHLIRASVEACVFEFEQTDVLGPRFSSFCGKLVALWGKLCMTLNYLEAPRTTTHVIPSSIAEMATALLFEHVVPSAAQVYAATGGAGADAEATQAVAGFILTKRMGRILSSELSRSVRACRGQSLEAITKTLSPLVAGGWLKPEQDFQPYSWHVAEQVHTQFNIRAASETERRRKIYHLLSGSETKDVDDCE